MAKKTSINPNGWDHEMVFYRVGGTTRKATEVNYFGANLGTRASKCRCGFASTDHEEIEAHLRLQSEERR